MFNTLCFKGDYPGTFETISISTASLVGWGFSSDELVVKLVATLLTCPSGQRLTYDERKYLRLIDATMHATLAEFSMLGVYLGRLPKWDKKT